MVLLIILNTIFAVWLIFKQLKLSISIRKETTFFNKTSIGYSISLRQKENAYIMSTLYAIHINFRNKQKTEHEEDIAKLIASDQQVKNQVLNARFSWLKTIDQVKKFESDYSIVDKKIVSDLVESFMLRNKSQ